MPSVEKRPCSSRSEMKHLLRKLHIGSSHSDHLEVVRHREGSTQPSGVTPTTVVRSSPDPSCQHPGSSYASSIPGWLTSVGRQLPSISTSQFSGGASAMPRDGGALGTDSGGFTQGDRGGDVIGGSPGSVDDDSDFRSLEEEYQVQLAMAISASNDEQSCDPELVELEAVKRMSLGLSPSASTPQAELVTLRFWMYNYLGFEDRVVDGFYDVYGITDSTTAERMPSLSDLQALPVIDTISYEVVLVNRAVDNDLAILEKQALDLAAGCGPNNFGILKSGLVEKLALLVAGHMGGPVANDVDMLTVWRTTSWTLKSSLHSIVLPLGKLRIGLARHRALLFKVLADSVGMPSRLVKGRQYTGVDEGALNIIRGDDDREYIIDLVGDPGTLIPPDIPGTTSSLNLLATCTSSCSKYTFEVSGAPNCGDSRPASIEEGGDGRGSVILQETVDMKIGSTFPSPPAGGVVQPGEVPVEKPFERHEMGCYQISPMKVNAVPQLLINAVTKNAHVIEQLPSKFSEKTTKGSFPASGCHHALQKAGHRKSRQADEGNYVDCGNSKWNSSITTCAPTTCGGTRQPGEDADSKPVVGKKISGTIGQMHGHMDSVLDDVAEWEIPWEELVMGERIGLGSYGEVYRGDWQGSEVAVKKFLDQDLSGDALEEFRSEVRIMLRLRHPNVVLFMGAVTRAPNLSIVTEFLPRGSLYRLLHRPHNQLDERRRLRMALDVAKGMNYLHSCTPLIVHRDLKSPNLLVDKNWVVKVCDFGLSRMKHHTFLSSKSTAGTPEWMAPEVLRNEPSNEKSDVYSFGVILWELATLQQPWGGMNPMQVVGAVGFQHRRLDIPNDLDIAVGTIIHQCWQNDPSMRPSFAQLVNRLRPLQRAVFTASGDAFRQAEGLKLLPCNQNNE